MQRLRNLLLISTALMPLASVSAFAGPQGGVVVGGSATINNPGTANVTVNQHSDKTIINWTMFNIGVGERVTFQQPNSNSIALNKVGGGLGPSEILGSLDANGKVFIINRDGIIFGAGAVINTAGFLATTSDIKNENFMAGRFNFDIPGRPDASIINKGTITAANGGFAALVAPGVRNSGTITANLGTVVLGAGNIFNLDFYGDRLITLGIGDQIAGQVKDVSTGQTLKSLVTNEGKLKANGGRVELTAAAARVVVDSVINTSGVIEANSVGMKNGQIVLSAATAAPQSSGPAGRGGAAPAAVASLPPQKVKVSGKLSASGKEPGTKGGSIVITGEHIEVAGATIDASGRDGGGKVIIGGDWGGGKPDTSLVNNQSAKLEGFAIPNATTVTVDAATKIDASAKDRGDGGKVILWSDQTTTFAGTILALGGREIGNGGFVETSGKGLLNYSGTVDLRAPNGANGTLLLDPWDVNITNSTSNGGGFSGGTWTPTATSNINVTDLLNQLLLGNVIVTTSGSGTDLGNITVSANISWSNNSSLALSAHNDVRITGGVAISNTGGASGNLTLKADSDGTGSGRVILDAGTFPNRIDWTNSNGKVTIYYNPLGGNYATPSDFSNGTRTGSTGPTFSGGIAAVSAPSKLEAYMWVHNPTNLQDVNTNLAGSYALSKNIDMTGVTGFAPIGDSVNGFFTGKFDGLGNTISNLTIAPTAPAAWNIGLFGAATNTSTISNLILNNFTVTANANVPFTPPNGVQYVGVLAGQMGGTVTNVQVTGSSTVNGVPGQWVIAGGLVGSANGTVTNSSSNANVSVGSAAGPANANYAGGLAGQVNGNLTGSSASGAVSVGANSFAGGLTGSVAIGSTVSTSSASGALTGTGNNVTLGGLAGRNQGTITGSSVTSGSSINVGNFNSIAAGGFVGKNQGTITNGTSVSNVTVGNSTTSSQENSVGGLVGINTGAITGSTVSGSVTGGAHSNVGGLVARNEFSGTIASSSATGNVNVGIASEQSVVGGLVGFNFGSVTGSNAGGAVTGGGVLNTFSTIIGGFVGINSSGASITGSTASGIASGGPNTEVGGFAGTNGGTISNSHSTGLLAGSLDGTAGGFVGFNQNTGVISNSDASNNVGSGGNTAGGFVGENFGQITNSVATGSVIGAGAVFGSTTAGGFAGFNDGQITGSRADGTVASVGEAGGFVGSNTGLIQNSVANGSVGVGSNSAAGGFVSGNFGDIQNSTANGSVSGADNTYLGGFAAGNFGLISTSHATGNVVAVGSNAVVGGFVGASFDQISNSTATGQVIGTSNSFLGGFVGINVDKIKDSTSSGNVNGSGAGNFAGGFAGLNFGNIDPSTSSGNVASGPNSIVGRFIGANAALQFPDGTQYIGTNTADSTGSGTATGGPGSQVGGQVGQSYPTSGAPDLPANSCSGQSSSTICGGTLFNPNGTQDLGGDKKDIPQISPLLNIATTLVSDTFTEKKTEEVVNTTNNSTGGGGSPGGQKGGTQGNQKGGAAGAGGVRPPIGAVAGYGLGPLPSGLPPLNETRFLGNEVVFQLGGAISPARLAALMAKFGLEITYREQVALLGRTVIRFRITGGIAVRDVIAAAENELGANFSFQPSYAFQLTQDLAQSGPADTTRKGDSAQYIVGKLGLAEAHLIATGKGVKVAVIDSEIDAKHPDLDGAVAGNYDALPDDDQTAHPHGTGMAGAIASHRRLLGVAPGAQLLAVRAFGVNSGSAQGTSLAIVKGLQWAVDQGAKIINMSFAGPRDPILQQAIKRLTDQGIILIGAAGNAGPKSPPLFPGADSNVIAVSATDADDKTYKNANRGKYVAIAAPGVDILVPAPDGGYQLTTGTSVAAAHISGVVALLLERDGSLRPETVRKILSDTAKNVGAPRTDLGAGLVDPVKALSKVQAKSAQLR